jgi:hypothetical protein
VHTHVREGFSVTTTCSLMGYEVKEYLRREFVRPVLRFLVRIVMVDLAILVLSVIGLWVFLSTEGQASLLNLAGPLAILLLLEGSLVGFAGALVFFGFSEYGVFRQAALNPAIARDQIQGWKERRLSQQKWGIAMLLAGVLLIFLGLAVSVFTSL